MPPFSVRPRFAVPAFLLLVLTGCGHKKEALPDKKPMTWTCTCTCPGDIKILVNEGRQRGVDQKAAYVCPTSKIIWEPESSSNVKSFRVEFVGDDLPFGSGPSNTIFDSDPNIQIKIGPLPALSELTVFKYKITITDNNGAHPSHDPHIIGGGG